jgi:prophage DNA circulation protein
VASKPGKIEPALLLSFARHLTRDLEDAQDKAAALQLTVGKSVAPPFEQAVQTFLQRLGMPGNTPADCQKRLEEVVRNEPIFAYLGIRGLPEARNAAVGIPRATEALNDPQLGQAMKAISEREPESKVARLVRPISADTILTAIEAAEAQGLAVEKASEPIEEGVKQLTAVVNDLLGMAAICHLAALEIETASTAGDNTHKTGQAFVQSNGRVQRAAEELSNLLQAGRYDYTARRYKREADNNLKTAVLYEVQVHKSSILSESHRRRSQFFFLGMLGA